MDLSIISAAAASLTAARDLGRAAMGVRDANLIAGTLTQMNDQILRAQDALFSHQAQLLALHEKLAHTQQQLRLAQEVVEQRSRYQLVELSLGVFVYRSKLGKSLATGHGEPLHYVCQPCLDVRGQKAVLIRYESMIEVTHRCPLCQTQYLESTSPMPAANHAHDPYS